MLSSLQHETAPGGRSPKMSARSSTACRPEERGRIRPENQRRETDFDGVQADPAGPASARCLFQQSQPALGLPGTALGTQAKACF